jgi:aspartyl-tRNA(Asn)/glutamyl-tRNA(Gln) amidotransferase subunit A
MRTVIEIAESVRAGSTTAVSVLEDCLSAIDAGNGGLNAFIHLDEAAARREAADIDAKVASGVDPGPLAGVPFGVKDLDDCAGMPTGRGSLWFSGEGPVDHDSIHVARLRAAGAVPVGKTAVPEFGFWAYTNNRVTGVTRNPWDTAVTPGGSSGGSASAVAAGMVPFATSSDGGGSTRTPAGFCGLVGHKPSFGRIPDLRGTRYSQTATAGALATTVADAARLLDVMAGPDDRDRTSLPAAQHSYEQVIDTLDVTGLRVGWSSDLGFAVVDPEVESITSAAAAALIDYAGAQRVDVDVCFDDLIATWAMLESSDRWVGLRPGLWPERADDLDQKVRPAFERSETMTMPQYAVALTRRREIELDLARLFSEVDVLLTPTSAIPAFVAEGPMPTVINGREGPLAGAVPFAMFCNMYGTPAVSVPAGMTRDGLPVGIQIAGRRHADHEVLRLARLLEQKQPWPRHAPGSEHASANG